MSRYALSVVAEDEDIKLLQAAAEVVPASKITTAQTLDDTVEALNFPIDADTLIESLKFVGAFFETTAAIKQLLDAWSSRRNKDHESKNRREDQIMIADVRSGRILYSGKHLDEAVVGEIIKAVEEKPAS